MFISEKDKLTGKTVQRLTPEGVLCHHPYFYNHMFAGGGRYLLHAREIAGRRNLWLLDLKDETAKQLTDEEGIEPFGAGFSADEKAFYYCIGNKVFCRKLSSGEAKVVYETPPEWQGYTVPTRSSDDRYLLTIELLMEDVLKSNGTWDTFEGQWAKKPLSRIVWVDLKTGESKVIHEENCWLGHPLMRPGRTDEAFFCHEGPAKKIDARLWAIGSDGTNMRCLRPQNGSELITHEFWLPDGSEMGFIYRQQLKAGAEVSDVHQSIRRMNTDTLKETVVMDCSVYCHSITDPTGRYLVGDGQNPKEPYIFVADMQEKTEAILCRHDTTWKSYGNTQDAHPHPVFSPDGSFVLFTSDKEGLPAIYRVML